MKSQTISGTPRLCPNRLCRSPFSRQSHRGYLPNDCFTVWVVMRCSTCADNFMICQSKADAWEYYQNLPNDPNSAKRGRKPISKLDVREIRKALKRRDILDELYERRNGLPPGELKDES